jgi:hypothetical protein
MFFIVAPAALPPIAPAMSWMIRLITVADMVFSPVLFSFSIQFLLIASAP